MTSAPTRSVAVVTLGCARNEVDSEELAGRLSAEGWTLVDDAAEADVAVVNTCGFVEQAKKDSIDAILEVGGLRVGELPHAGVGHALERGRRLVRLVDDRQALAVDGGSAVDEVVDGHGHEHPVEPP